jgi:endonuclease/exonuclease/phosphatase family metal-dependent hydrolase
VLEVHWVLRARWVHSVLRDSGMNHRQWSSLLFAGLLWWGAAQSSPHTIRVLTYNIHHGEGTDGEFDLPRLARIIESIQPDLVALQEVDQGTQRSSGVNQLTELGRLTRMHAVFGKAMDFQGGGYGVGVLSRWPLKRVENHPLPDPPDREPRTSLTVDVRVGRNGPLVKFTSTHLDSGRDLVNRMAQADELNSVLVHDDGVPAILAGDLNSQLQTQVLQILETSWSNVSPEDPPPAVPTGRPGRVDHVLVRPFNGWKVVEASVVDAPIASDHRPVLVVLQWSENSNVVVSRH